MKAANLFVKCLESAGVKYLFALPGEENLSMLNALKTSSIKLIITRHEQSAVFMAATYGRLTGKAGVVMSTLGPGATNLVTGIAHAQLGGMPVVVITGQKPIRKSKQGKFQIIDVVQMMRPITKSTETIPSGDRIPSMVAEAFKLAEAERPGVVHLELPEDVAEDLVNLKPFEYNKVRRPAPDPKAIKQALSLLNTAQHPIILVASGSNRKLIAKQLNRFINKTHIPFVTTQMGKGVINESSKLYLGTTALTDSDYVHCALNKADVIVVIGHDISEKPPVIMTRDTHKVIHINYYESAMDDVYVPTVEVVGDIAHSLYELNEQIKPSKKWNFDYYKKLKNFSKKQIAEKSADDSYPLKPQRIVADIRQVMPKDGILSLDNGMYKIWVSRNYPAYEQNTVLLDNALATMGAGLPAGLAAKLVYPKKKVLVVAGDGGIMMNIAELETAIRLKLNISILILKDDGFGMIRWKQQESHLKNFGLSFGNPDFVKLAESFGAHGYKIKKAHDLKKILKSTLSKPGVHVIECAIDYEENYLVFDQELKDKTCHL